MAKVTSKTNAGSVVRRKPTGPGVAKTRGNPPGLLAGYQPCYAFRLEPKGKVKHAPITVWGYQTETGWTGWIKEHKATQLLPTKWSKDNWQELALSLPTETASIADVKQARRK